MNHLYHVYMKLISGIEGVYRKSKALPECVCLVCRGGGWQLYVLELHQQGEVSNQIDNISY